MSVLDYIVAGVRIDLAEREDRVSFSQIRSLAEHAPPARDPMAHFRAPGLSVISEVKRKSPSKGELAEIPDPAVLAGAYTSGGDAAISDLTAKRLWTGRHSDQQAVRERGT